MLDEEPYLSDPYKKLTLTINLPLNECSIDTNAFIEIQITFDNQKKSFIPASSNIRDTIA